MHIQSLCVRVTDADAACLLKRIPEGDLPVQGVTIRLVSEGVLVEGTYPTFMISVPFRMVWRLEVAAGKVQATLVNLSLSGVPAGPFRGLILAFARDEVAKIPGLTMEGETVVADLAALVLSELGVTLTVVPREVRHEPGAVVFLAGE